MHLELDNMHKRTKKIISSLQDLKRKELLLQRNLFEIQNKQDFDSLHNTKEDEEPMEETIAEALKKHPRRRVTPSWNRKQPDWFAPSLISH